MNKRILFSALALSFSTVHASIVFTITHEHCSNTGGVVTTQVTGGVPPYTYDWSNGATTENLVNVPAGSYTLTVTDFVGAQQQNIAVVQNLGWEWNPFDALAQAVPSCDGQGMGWVFFGMSGNGFAPQGPGPHQYDQSCLDPPFGANVPSDFSWFIGEVQATCFSAISGTTYAVNYTDADGCPGYMEAVVPQPLQFYPITLLDVQGSCSGGANGSVLFSIPPEADYIYGMRPHLFNPDGQENFDFWNTQATNWTGGWTYDVHGLAPGTHSLVRRITIDPMFDAQFPCGDTTLITIPDLGPTCGNVSGTVALDVNEDCTLTSSDARIPEMILEFTPGPYYATTNTQGEYSLNLPLGSYTVAQLSAVLDEHCLADPVTLNVTGNTILNLLDTALMAKDIQLTMASGPARPGFELHYAIDLDNLTSASSPANSLVMTFDANVSYIAATPAPSSVVGNTITWNNIGSLSYFGHRDVSVRLQVPPDVGLLGTEVQATATVTSAGDGNLSNNTATWLVMVTGSYDPNDKVATTSSGYSRDLYYIDVDQWIDYVIRFQNTGTDTAFTVVITDTLPATLDASTLVVGGGSHPFTWSLQGNGTLKFYFINILLPDSNINEPLSHGFVGFRIRPRAPLLTGNVIENTANIYFDFNPPVITEPSVLVAEFSTGVREQTQERIRLHPNPTSEQLMLYLPEGATAAFNLLSTDGRRLIVPATRRNDGLQLDVRSLAPGVYMLRTASGSARFVKQ